MDNQMGRSKGIRLDLMMDSGSDPALDYWMDLSLAVMMAKLMVLLSDSKRVQRLEQTMVNLLVHSLASSMDFLRVRHLAQELEYLLAPQSAL